MRRPAVSVLMAFYDDGSAAARSYFSQALKSILAQRFRDFEVVLAVSGRKEFAQKEAGKSRKIRLIFFEQEAIAENRPVSERLEGLVRARNLCLANARGKYFAIADADDISLPARLGMQLDYMEKHPETGLLGSTMEIIGPDGKRIGWRGAFESDKEIRARMLQFSPISSPTVFGRTEIARKAGGYEKGELAEDYSLWVRMAALTKMHNLGKALVKYRAHSRNSSGYRLEYFMSSLRVKRKAAKLLGLRAGLMDIAINVLQLGGALALGFAGAGRLDAWKSAAAGAIYPEYSQKKR